MDTTAVLLSAPRALGLGRVGLADRAEDEVVVDVDWSGVSTGTERLLWSGRMPPFPGLGYPLVPGYESVGRIVAAGADARERLGERVFVPGSTAFLGAKGLFGGAARRLIVKARRAVPIAEDLREEGVLIALAATAAHAIAGGQPPELIVGHGVLGRLLARITLALGHPAPTVWETNPDRRVDANGYAVIDPETDERRDYRAIYDASGAEGLLDRLIPRLAPRGEIVLAGFYETPLSFAFPPAFMREARIRIAAEWQPEDIARTTALIDLGVLSLKGLVTHHAAAVEAPDAYRTAFEDPACLKLVLDWRGCP